MKYKIKGLDRETGAQRDITVEAKSERDALEEAARQNCFVEAVTPLPPESEVAAPPVASGLSNAMKEATIMPMSRAQGMVVIVLLLIGLGAPFASWLRPVPKWEYKITSPIDEILTMELADLGHDGWELVFARRATSGSGSFSDASYEMIFKRPRP